MMRFLSPALAAGGRILLAFIMIAIPAAIVRLVLVPGMEALLNLSDPAVVVLRRVGMMTGIVAGYWMYVRLVEKRAAAELSFRPATIGLSGLAGSASIAVPMFVLYVFGAFALTGTGGDGGLAGIALLILAAALLEEVVFRAVIFGIIERHLGLWSALLAPSLLFSALHLFNFHWGGWAAFVSVVLLGLMWSLVYAVTRNLWAATANHALWNFTIILTGLPLTGQQQWRAAAPLHSEIRGNVLWTGGEAGPEGSLLVILFVIVITSGLLWFVRAGARSGVR